jgi:hypothetical protein
MMCYTIFAKKYPIKWPGNIALAEWFWRRNVRGLRQPVCECAFGAYNSLFHFRHRAESKSARGCGVWCCVIAEGPQLVRVAVDLRPISPRFRRTLAHSWLYGRLREKSFFPPRAMYGGNNRCAKNRSFFTPLCASAIRAKSARQWLRDIFERNQQSSFCGWISLSLILAFGALGVKSRSVFACASGTQPHKVNGWP